MARAFMHEVDATLNCVLEGEEKAIVMQVAQEVAELIHMDLGQPVDESSPLAAASKSEDPLSRLEAEFAGIGTHRVPTDSAVKRLFPDAVSDDPDAAAEFRRFSQSRLVEDKVAALQQVIKIISMSGPDSSTIVLDRSEGLLWVKALTDMRLVLGDRMGIRNDDDFELLEMLRAEELEPVLSEDEQSAGTDYLASVYEFLSWLQESLIHALSK